MCIPGVLDELTGCEYDGVIVGGSMYVVPNTHWIDPRYLCVSYSQLPSLLLRMSLRQVLVPWDKAAG